MGWTTAPTTHLRSQLCSPPRPTEGARQATSPTPSAPPHPPAWRLLYHLAVTVSTSHRNPRASSCGSSSSRQRQEQAAYLLRACRAEGRDSPTPRPSPPHPATNPTPATGRGPPSTHLLHLRLRQLPQLAPPPQRVHPLPQLRCIMHLQVQGRKERFTVRTLPPPQRVHPPPSSGVPCNCGCRKEKK